MCFDLHLCNPTVNDYIYLLISNNYDELKNHLSYIDTDYIHQKQYKDDVKKIYTISMWNIMIIIRFRSNH